MESEWKYITQNDELNFLGFLAEHFPPLFLNWPNSLYHYTTGENLINIISSGQLWSTHVACLNDATEIRYATDQLRERIETRLVAPGDPDMIPLVRSLDEILCGFETEIRPTFVTCFSELYDDLSQWRAYSGGEGGYAIEFDSSKLRIAGGTHEIILLRVEYNLEKQAVIVDGFLQYIEQYYTEAEGRKLAPSLEAWAQEFAKYFLEQFFVIATCLKSSAFEAEREWRLVNTYRPDDPTLMQFRQRQSMMSRHLPLRLGMLPITRALVGPCRHPLLSRIAVNDLLQTYKYHAAVGRTDLTKIPYRAV
jgi:hypothetical protein